MYVFEKVSQFLYQVCIYLPHTSQKSVLDPIQRPGWYESSGKDPMPGADWYQQIS